MFLQLLQGRLPIFVKKKKFTNVLEIKSYMFLQKRKKNTCPFEPLPPFPPFLAISSEYSMVTSEL